MIELYEQIRKRTMDIVAPLEIEDYVIQTAEFMSPPRWHIGHTSWFFETLLHTYNPNYKIYNEDYLFYFNSYYEGFGKRIARASRGTRSRPTVKDTIAYRNYVDQAMKRFLIELEGHADESKISPLVKLGLEHEMQHQELLVYDIKHLLCDLYNAPTPLSSINKKDSLHLKSVLQADIEGGIFELGYDGRGFAWDNEKPLHKVYLQDYSIDIAPVTNGQYLEFILDGGYSDFRFWLSEGWEAVNKEHWDAPLYWEKHDNQWRIRDFHGLHSVSDKRDEPVSHVSYYEAAAYTKWAGKRLPTEAEWEKAACYDPKSKVKHIFPWGDFAPENKHANLFENQLWSVSNIEKYPEGASAYGCINMIGDVWEWTSSDYAPYPGFRTEFDEYNDKWFVGQKVLRGGSFATPRIHIRATYRNFFHPNERWMIAGFRCIDTKTQS